MQGDCSFGIFPVEIWLLILRHCSISDLVVRVGLVSRALNFLVQDKFLWRVVDLTEIRGSVDDPLINRLAIEKRVVRRENNFAVDSFKTLSIHLREDQQRSVYIYSSILWSESPVSWQLRPLRSINLSGCSLITDEALLTIATQLGPSQLSQLDISSCPKVTSEGLAHLSKHCPHLSTLNLSRCTGILDLTVLAHGLASFSLKSLIISAMADSFDQPGLLSTNGDGQVLAPINPASIQCLIENCPLLRYLHLAHNCTSVQDETIMQVLPACTRKRNLIKQTAESGSSVDTFFLSLALCFEITGAGVRNFLELREAQISALTENSARSLVLDLSWCLGIDDDEYEGLVKDFSNVQFIRQH